MKDRIKCQWGQWLGVHGPSGIPTMAIDNRGMRVEPAQTGCFALSEFEKHGDALLMVKGEGPGEYIGKRCVCVVEHAKGQKFASPKVDPFGITMGLPPVKAWQKCLTEALRAPKTSDTKIPKTEAVQIRRGFADTLREWSLRERRSDLKYRVGLLVGCLEGDTEARRRATELGIPAI